MSISIPKTHNNIANGNQRNEEVSILGKKLALDHKKTFVTWFGKCISLRAYIDFITIEGYPLRFVTKPPTKRSEFSKIPTKKVILPNFYAVLTLGLIDKIKSDVELQQMIKDNTEPYIMESSKKKEVEVFNTKVTLDIGEKKFDKYLEIVNKVVELVKQNKLYDDEATQEVLAYFMVKPEEGLFANIPFVKED